MGAPNMKIAVVTTMNKRLYDEYGHRFLKTYNWPFDCYVYYEDNEKFHPVIDEHHYGRDGKTPFFYRDLNREAPACSKFVKRNNHRQIADKRKDFWNIKNQKIPSEGARKAVEESYALLAEELHQASPGMANRMLKQFAEMEQYDSEIAGGDECYLPGHGSFPAGDKLLFEKGRTTGKQVSFVSIKYGKYGDVYGCPANGSALQQIHPDETKRNLLNILWARGTKRLFLAKLLGCLH